MVEGKKTPALLLVGLVTYYKEIRPVWGLYEMPIGRAGYRVLQKLVGCDGDIVMGSCDGSFLFILRLAPTRFLRLPAFFFS